MKREEILQQAANGNAEALAFLQVFTSRAHWIDDLADGFPPDISDPLDLSRRPRPYELTHRESEWLLLLAGNRFFLAHRAQLVPAMLLALSSWEDSHKFSAAQQSVVKGQWHEVIYLVAWITGGWNHMRACASNREYDVDIEITEEPRGCDYCGKPITPQHFPLNGMKFCGLKCGQSWKYEHGERRRSPKDHCTSHGPEIECVSCPDWGSKKPE